MEWLGRALCQGIHAHIWYPPLESPNPGNYYAVGKRVCAKCPVWRECLDNAMENNETWGMWGGLTPQERKGTARVAHGTVENFRLGCECSECKKAYWTTNRSIDIDKLPRHGEDFDISELIFVLSDD